MLYCKIVFFCFLVLFNQPIWALESSEVTTKPNPLSQLLKGLPSLQSSASQDELLPPDQAFQFSAVVKDARTLHVSWKLAKGYYLYREKTQLTIVANTHTKLGAYALPHGKPKHDEAFGKVEIFYNTLDVDVPLIRFSKAAHAIVLQASYQGCADRGVCYPPMIKKIDLSLPAAEQMQADRSAETLAASPELSEQDQIVQSLRQDSLWVTLLSFFGFGFLLSLTPCIFPMIPILSGLIVGRGKDIPASRSFLMSLCYVLASAATYTLFGVLAAVFGSNLQSTFQQPWIIITFSAVFVLLALSMFDFYHLEVPKSLQAKLHNSSEKHRDGSLWGAAIMGALSSLIVGPCVAAPLAGALIYIGQTGNVILGGSALFVMGLGMGIPLLILGASAGKLLPKAGDWLHATKAVFGVIMLGVAVWMLSRILPPDIPLLLWGVLLIVSAVYLHATDSLPEICSGWRKLWKGMGLIMLTYGLLLLIGFSLGNTNPLKPLQGLVLNNAQSKEQGLSFDKVTSIEALEQRLQQASVSKQKVMLDFYADWCISCKEMEAYTFTDPSVKSALKDFMLLQADVTKNSEDDKALLAKFNLVGPPGVLFFGSDQHEQTALRVIGYQKAELFLKTLNRVTL
ncbi:Thiol:disulfide interchange protein DsbD [Crenothrix polyspora]|uniref:Thiol:disulfide interchange protein DsbD n=1 Tax=Crenothrix polyspora TaxID=360316 RepID=A0A1R4H9W7_9GAMM|nr:protein-disulfide reductase DsbD [Crenothrix polyspora]SJM93058.1 Thiol:disulfide interchange protein DsbD [Crenothrix polyspora]